jgi:DNA-binding PadR family transcriptional regulator
MGASRAPAPLTPPGIAILSLLRRQPMHPYEMRHRIRVQEIDRVMKVTHGTLYSTVDRLAASGLIQPVETSRDGRRPERTVYEITDLGRDQLLDAIRDGLMRARPDYPQLAMCLAFASQLEPEEVAQLLERRCIEAEGNLTGMIAAVEASQKSLANQQYRLPRIHLIEEEYLIAMQRSELDWLRAIVVDISEGRMSWDPTRLLAIEERRATGEGPATGEGARDA